MAEEQEKLELEEDGLYIILSKQGLAGFPLHWGLYLHTSSETGGLIFHIRNTQEDPTWFFEQKSSKAIMYSRTLVVALKIAVVESKMMHDALQSFMGTTESGISMEDPNQFGQLTCRTWVLQAIYQLDQIGYISIMPGYTVRDVEFEAFSIGMANARLSEKIPQKRLFKNCQYSKA